MSTTDPYAALATRRTATPQSEAAVPEQVQNAAGGYTFRASDLALLDRFLVIGVQGGTYYTSEQKLTRETGGLVLDLARTRGRDVVDRVIAISTAGRALRQDPGLFALAAVSALAEDDDARRAAFDAVPLVARTQSTLTRWLHYRLMFGGKGPLTERALRAYFDGHAPGWLAFQAVKYGTRNGWSGKDLLMIARPTDREDPPRKALYRWLGGRADADLTLPDLAVVRAFEAAKGADARTVAALIADPGLPHEAVPSDAKRDPRVWRALLDNDRLPPHALVRNLASMTRAGVFKDQAAVAAAKAVLTDPARLRGARLHPMALLIALGTYRTGASERGTSQWTPVSRIIDVLDESFYAAFKAVEPTGARISFNLDVSASMGHPVAGVAGVTCAQAGAAMGLVLLQTEPNAEASAFSGPEPHTYQQNYWGQRQPLYADGDVVHTPYGPRPRPVLKPLDLSPRRRLDDNVAAVGAMTWGATDCSLPVRAALDARKPIDLFVVATDNETWAGPQHPHEALREYRRRMGIDARMLVLSMTATGTSIADPTDPGMLDVAGLDANVPQIIAEFARG